MAAAEKARLERICVNGVTASMKGELISIFLGTIIVSPGSKTTFFTKMFLLTFSVRPFALII